MNKYELEEWDCENHKFFAVAWFFNNGNPYPYLSCEECDMSYGWKEPRDWPEIPVMPHVYIVGVPRV